MADVEVGDVVLARDARGSFYAVVRGVRLNRLVVERCDARPAGPLRSRDVISVFKRLGEPHDSTPDPARKRPTSQLRLDLR